MRLKPVVSQPRLSPEKTEQARIIEKLKSVHHSKIGHTSIQATTSNSFAPTQEHASKSARKWKAYSPSKSNKKIVTSRDHPLLMGKLPGFVYNQQDSREMRDSVSAPPPKQRHPVVAAERLPRAAAKRGADDSSLSRIKEELRLKVDGIIGGLNREVDALDKEEDKWFEALGRFRFDDQKWIGEVFERHKRNSSAAELRARAELGEYADKKATEVRILEEHKRLLKKALSAVQSEIEKEELDKNILEQGMKDKIVLSAL